MVLGIKTVKKKTFFLSILTLKSVFFTLFNKKVNFFFNVSYHSILQGKFQYYFLKFFLQSVVNSYFKFSISI